MRGQTHVSIGVAATTLLMATGVLNNSIITIGATVIGAFLPDIDCDDATINNQFGLNKVIYFVMAMLICCINPSIYSFFIALVFIAVARSKHRGITHSLPAIIFVFISTVRLNFDLFIGLNIGYITHIITDYFSDGGIQLLYPKRKRYKAPITLRTGRFYENILRRLAEIICIVGLLYIYRMELKLI